MAESKKIPSKVDSETLKALNESKDLDRYFWQFGVNRTIDIEQWSNEEKTYSYKLISYWYDFDKRGRLRLERVQHCKSEYIPPSEFAIIHRLLHEAIAELKWMSKVR